MPLPFSAAAARLAISLDHGGIGEYPMEILLAWGLKVAGFVALAFAGCVLSRVLASMGVYRGRRRFLRHR
jgi:hypothetical protein